MPMKRLSKSSGNCLIGVLLINMPMSSGRNTDIEAHPFKRSAPEVGAVPSQNRYLLEVVPCRLEGVGTQVQGQNDRFLPLQFFHAAKKPVPTRAGQVHPCVSIACIEHGFGYRGWSFAHQEVALLAGVCLNGLFDRFPQFSPSPELPGGVLCGRQGEDGPH